jgi:hypothetical protein
MIYLIGILSCFGCYMLGYYIGKKIGTQEGYDNAKREIRKTNKRQYW